MLDAVQNSRGLEQLIVVSIALDTSIDGNADNETRSYLYTGITRAQLQAVVVNHFIPDGWLAFLGTLKLKNEKFTQRAALAAIRKDAATSAVADAPRPATEKQDKEAAKQHTEVSRLKTGGWGKCRVLFLLWKYAVASQSTLTSVCSIRVICF